MDSGFEESNSTECQGPSSSSSSADSGAGDAANFECNICFDLAQDPIVTLCGHLFCWPCLFKWLNIHAQSHECPVCKAIIQEEKLVPLYGRGKTPSDPRSRSVPGVEIPQRPTGQRPETAQPTVPDHFPQQGLGFMGGFPPMAAGRWGNFTFSAGIGGLFPSLFNFHVHGFPDAAAYGAAAAPFPHGFSNFHGGHVHGEHFHGGHVRGFPRRHVHGRHADSHLTALLVIVGMLVILALIGL